ncbi:DUF4156 domain-containing protein [Methylophilaceae bacterium]|nr:DUF4156 domain-containing protein [Methylophilaceae bacterium]
MLLISCGSAKFVQESPGSEDVNLVTSIDQNQCEYKGEVKDKVKGYSDDFLGTSEKNLIQLGKNGAVEKNGNTIIMSEYRENRGSMSALYKIYFCR